MAEPVFSKGAKTRQGLTAMMFVTKKGSQNGPKSLILLCRRRDSNPHASRRHPLKMVCLPIPPLRLCTAGIKARDYVTSSAEPAELQPEPACPAAVAGQRAFAVRAEPEPAEVDSAAWRPRA